MASACSRVLSAVACAAQRRGGRLAGVALGCDLVEVDDGNDRSRDGLRARSGGGRMAEAARAAETINLFIRIEFLR